MGVYFVLIFDSDTFGLAAYMYALSLVSSPQGITEVLILSPVRVMTLQSCCGTEQKAWPTSTSQVMTFEIQNIQ